MGLAMWSTLFAMFVTAAGALSLSTDKDIVRSTYWVYVEATNSTERTRYFLGLRSIVYIHQGDVRSERLDTDIIVGTLPGSQGKDPMRKALLDSCADSAHASALGALLSCVTLIFALIGTMNRMRFSSDANVQKALGLVLGAKQAACAHSAGGALRGRLRALSERAIARVAGRSARRVRVALCESGNICLIHYRLVAPFRPASMTGPQGHARDDVCAQRTTV